MKGMHFSCVAAILLLTGTVTADLTVYEYVLGQPVTLDTNTGKYWNWNLVDFIEETCAGQAPAIAGSGKHGNTAGAQHMAVYDDVQALCTYVADSITAVFTPSLLDSSYTYYLGGYDYPTLASTTRYLGSPYVAPPPKGLLGSTRLALTTQTISDTLANHAIGAWDTGTGNGWSVLVPAGRQQMALQASQTKLYTQTR
jgi:hypothetical protein